MKSIIIFVTAFEPYPIDYACRLFTGTTNVNNASTGAAIFGASPVPSQPVIPAAFGHAPDRTIITPPPLTKIQGAQISEDHFSKPVSNNSDWAALWPKEHHSNGVNTIPIENAESSEKQFGLPLATSSRTITSAFSTASNNLPINPFTGNNIDLYIITKILP